MLALENTLDTVAAIHAPLGIRVVVVDTGPLLNDVLRRSRQDHVTSLVQTAGVTRVRASVRPGHSATSRCADGYIRANE